MMFYMTSKVFRDEFLVNERDNDILDAQYVIASTRIRRRDKSIKNIIIANAILYPDPDVCSSYSTEEFKEKYFDQLDKSKYFLATLIKGSIEEGYNIIFICSKNEGKMKFLKYLSQFIYCEFDYPVYDYSTYANGSCRSIQ